MANTSSVKTCPHCKLEVDPKASRCPHCHGKIYQWSFTKKFIAVAMIFIAIIFFISVSSGGSSPSTSTVSSNSPTPSFLSIGSQGHVKAPAGKGEVEVFPTKGGLDEFIKSAVANDSYGMAQAYLDYGGFKVKDGTKVLALDSTIGSTKFRILEGDHAGEAGWLPDEFLTAN